MKKKTQRLVILGLLTAIMIVMTITNFGYITFGVGIEFTLMCIPVIIATLTLGLSGGEIIAFVFALTSMFIALFRPTGLALLLQPYPWVLYPTIFIPRLLIPVAISAVSKLTQKWKNRSLSIGFSSAVGSLTNTVLFLGMLYVLGSNIMAGSSGWAILKAWFTATLAINGSIEAIAAVILCTPIIAALKHSRILNE